MNTGLSDIVFKGLGYPQVCGFASPKNMAAKGTPIKIEASMLGENCDVTDSEATTADKNPISISKKQKTEQYDNIYSEKIASLNNEVTQEDKGLEKQNGSEQNNNVDGQPETLQDLPADNPDKLEQAAGNSQKPAVTNEMFFVQTAGYDFDKLLAGLNASSPFLANIYGTETGQNNLTQSIINPENQTTGTIDPAIVSVPLSANGLIGEGENQNEAAILNKTAVSAEKQGKTVIPQTDAAKILAAVDNTALDVQESGITNQPDVHSEQNTLTNNGMPINQDKSTNIQSQLNDSDLQKAAGLINKLADNPDKTCLPAGKVDDTNQQENSGIQTVPKSINNNDTTDNGNSSSESDFKKLNPEQIIYTSKTKDPDFIGGAHTSGDLSLEQSSRGAPIKSGATNNATAGSPRGESGEVSTSIGRQIQESIQTSLRQDQQQVTMRLNPPELGRVYIKFQEQNGQIIGLLEVSKEETKSEIQQALPQMLQNLSEAGIQVKRLDVQLANQQDQQSLKDQSSPASFTDSHSEQQSSEGFNQQTNNPGWLNNPEGIGTGWQSYNDFIPIESGQVQISDNSINMLV